MRIKVVSVDMFQTLVDVNKRIPEIWKEIYGSLYTEEKAKEGAHSIVSHVQEVLNEACHSEYFMTMEEVYTKCASMTVEECEISKTPSKVSHCIMEQHGFAPFYEDVLKTLKELRKEYKIVLSSDSNHLMVDRILEQLRLDEVFISEDLQCYKGDMCGRFFEKVVERLGVYPGEILHIGDSLADVEGAYRTGVRSCYINRTGRVWKHGRKPDMEIQSLREIRSILENIH